MKPYLQYCFAIPSNITEFNEFIDVYLILQKLVQKWITYSWKNESVNILVILSWKDQLTFL